MTEYKGRKIVIGTTYRIEVDGRLVGGHFVVTDEGQVQCHAMPNYTFSSAVDLVKSMIDVFPEDFSGAAPDDGHDHAGHERGAPPRAARVASAAAKPAPSRAKKPTAKRGAGKRAPRGGRHGRH